MVRQSLPWLFEHSRGASIRSAAVTAGRILIPWSFWKRVQLHHRVSVLRLCMFPVVVVLGLYVVSTAIGLLAFGVRAAFFGQHAKIIQLGSWLENVGYIATSQLGVFWSQYWRVWSGYSTDEYFIGAIIWSVSFGIMLSALISQSSFKNTPVRIAHLFRITVYSFLPAMFASFLLVALWTCDRVVRNDYGGSKMYFYTLPSGSPPSLQLSAWDLLRATIRGWIEGPMVSLVAPVAFLYLWWFFALRTGLRLRDWWQILLAGLFLGPLVALAIGFAISAVLALFA